MSGAGLDRMASRGTVIHVAAKALRSGKNPQQVAQLLELHDKRLYDVPVEKLPGFVAELIREVGL